MSRGAVGLVLGALAVGGCAQLLGFHDLAERAGMDAGDARADQDGTSPLDAGCVPSDPLHDPKNCGRCGRDCLGGRCEEGSCTSVVLVGGFSEAITLAVDPTSVYATLQAEGSVVRVPKDGGVPTVLVTGHRQTRGVALDGDGGLYWANRDELGDGGGDTAYGLGGIYGCTLPACADVRVVTLASYPLNVRFVSGYLYFAEFGTDTIVRVSPDGTERIQVGQQAHPFSVTADATHVYFLAQDARLDRALLDGGSQENIVSPEGALGLVELDDERVYWTARQKATATGRVRSVRKDDLHGPVIVYAAETQAPAGLAVDDQMLYWIDEGTLGPPSGNDGKLLACPKKQGCGTASPDRQALMPGHFAIG